MSQEEKQNAEQLMRNYLKLERGDQRYVEGWVDAKAASRDEEKKEA